MLSFIKVKPWENGHFPGSRLKSPLLPGSFPQGFKIMSFFERIFRLKRKSGNNAESQESLPAQRKIDYSRIRITCENRNSRWVKKKMPPRIKHLPSPDIKIVG